MVRLLLQGRGWDARGEGRGVAPVNIALCKYWGKRDEELNLPVTASLSVALPELQARTRIRRDPERDRLRLNGRDVPPEAPAARRLFAYLDLVRPAPEFLFAVDSESDVPVGAGLASSAAGFAAAARAVDDLFGWGLAARELSILARLGSGSACRSVYPGFVTWQAGTRADGMDSVAEPLDATWPDLRLGVLEVSAAEKPVGSREGMRRTKATSTLYPAWPGQAARDLDRLQAAIAARDFAQLGATAEANALAMHATMLAAWPPLLYWQPESVAMMHRVWGGRAAGIPVYLTMDAGPNLKLLFEAGHAADLTAAFPGIKVLCPFAAADGAIS